MAPPSPITEDGLDDHTERFLTIDTLVARPASNYFPARVILDGNTLLPRDSLSSEALTEDEDPQSFDELPVSVEPEDDIGARGIVRPVSTPPSTSPSAAKVIRVSIGRSVCVIASSPFFVALRRRNALSHSKTSQLVPPVIRHIPHTVSRARPFRFRYLCSMLTSTISSTLIKQHSFSRSFSVLAAFPLTCSEQRWTFSTCKR